MFGNQTFVFNLFYFCFSCLRVCVCGGGAPPKPEVCRLLCNASCSSRRNPRRRRQPDLRRILILRCIGGCIYESPPIVVGEAYQDSAAFRFNSVVSCSALAGFLSAMTLQGGIGNVNRIPFNFLASVSAAVRVPSALLAGGVVGFSRISNFAASFFVDARAFSAMSVEASDN